MTRQRMRTVVVTRVDSDGSTRRPDRLVVEEPLAIELDGVRVATTMRTPGHDFELAAGFCFTEGLLAGEPVASVRYCATGSALDTAYNVVTVSSAGKAPAPTARLGAVTSSCGLCGSASLEELTARLGPLPDASLARFDAATIAATPQRVLGGQGVYGETGAAHAAAAFAPDGTVALTREDVGRHNAVDKVVGRLLLDGALPAHGLALFVSGRASFEIVQKAWAAGFGTVVAVSAPTALAVEAARLAGMTLAGFVRPGGFNLYAPERPHRDDSLDSLRR
jgi:FdhD protein